MELSHWFVVNTTPVQSLPRTVNSRATGLLAEHIKPRASSSSSPAFTFKTALTNTEGIVSLSYNVQRLPERQFTALCRSTQPSAILLEHSPFRCPYQSPSVSLESHPLHQYGNHSPHAAAVHLECGQTGICRKCKLHTGF